MLRSMYSGISGMRGFQTKLDVIGNNIANVNTVGFKAGRVMFKDILSQTMSVLHGNRRSIRWCKCEADRSWCVDRIDRYHAYARQCHDNP